MESLNEDVRTKLRSMTTISSLQHAVEELVLNSLDANSSVIKVSVDHQLFKIQVEDNGCGISWADLKLLGTRYTTSKSRETVPCFGHRGEAIASLVKVSGRVEVTTRPRNLFRSLQDDCNSMKSVEEDDVKLCIDNQEEKLWLDPIEGSGSEVSHAKSHSTFVKHFYQGMTKEINHACEDRPEAGTSVTLHNFFYCFPIRRKIMREAIDLENIKDWLEGMAIVHPQVSFSLKKDCGDVSYLLKTKNCSSAIERVEELYGPELRECLVKVCHRIEEIQIRGFISAKYSTSKRFQFLYVNKLLIRKTSVHKFLNKLMDRTVLSSSHLEIIPFRGSGSSKSPISPSKSTKMYGVFFLEIECPSKDYNVATETNKTFIEFKDTSKVLQSLERAVYSFCKSQGISVPTREASNCEPKEVEKTNVHSKCCNASESAEDFQGHKEEAEPTENLESFVCSKTQEKLDAFRRKTKKCPGRSGEEPACKYGRLVGLWDLRTAVQGSHVKRPRKDQDSKPFSKCAEVGTEQNGSEEQSQTDVHQHSSDSGDQGECGTLIGSLAEMESSEEADDGNWVSQSSERTTNPSVKSNSSLHAFKKVFNEMKNNGKQSIKGAESKRKTYDEAHEPNSGNKKKLKGSQSRSVGGDIELLAKINSFGSSVKNSGRRPTHDLSSSDESSDESSGDKRTPRGGSELAQSRHLWQSSGASASQITSTQCNTSSPIQEFCKLIGLHRGKSSVKFPVSSLQQDESDNSRAIACGKELAEPSGVSSRCNRFPEHKLEAGVEFKTPSDNKETVALPSCSAQGRAVVAHEKTTNKTKHCISGSLSNKNRTKVVDVKLPLKDVRATSSLGHALRLKRKQELARYEAINFLGQFRHPNSSKTNCEKLPNACKEVSQTNNEKKSSHFNFDPLILPSRPVVVSRTDALQRCDSLSSAGRLKDDAATEDLPSSRMCYEVSCCPTQRSPQTGSETDKLSSSDCGIDRDRENSNLETDLLNHQLQSSIHCNLPCGVDCDQENPNLKTDSLGTQLAPSSLEHNAPCVIDCDQRNSYQKMDSLSTKRASSCSPEHSALYGLDARGVGVRSEATSSSQVSPEDVLTYNSHPSHCASHEHVSEKCTAYGTNDEVTDASPYFRTAASVEVSNPCLSRAQHSLTSDKMMCATPVLKKVLFTQGRDSPSVVCNRNNARNSPGDNSLLNAKAVSTSMETQSSISDGYVENCDSVQITRTIDDTGRDVCTTAASACNRLALSPFFTLLDLNQNVSLSNNSHHPSENANKLPALNTDVRTTDNGVKYPNQLITECTSLKDEFREKRVEVSRTEFHLLSLQKKLSSSCETAPASIDTISSASAVTSTTNISKAASFPSVVSEQFMHVNLECPVTSMNSSRTALAPQLRCDEVTTNSTKIDSSVPLNFEYNSHQLASQSCQPVSKMEGHVQDCHSSSGDSLWLTQPSRGHFSPGSEASKSLSRVPQDDMLVSMKLSSMTSPKRTSDFFSSRSHAKAIESELIGQLSQMGTSEAITEEAFVIGASVKSGLETSLSQTTPAPTEISKTGSLSSRLSTALKESAQKQSQNHGLLVADTISLSANQLQAADTQEPFCKINFINRAFFPSAVKEQDSHQNALCFKEVPALCNEPSSRLAGKLASIVSSERTSSSILSGDKNIASDTSSVCDIPAHVATDNDGTTTTSDATKSPENTLPRVGLGSDPTMLDNSNPLTTSEPSEITAEDSNRIKAQNSTTEPLEELGEWKKVISEGGDVFYVHRRSGNSSYSAPFVTTPSSESTGSCAIPTLGVQRIPISGEPRFVTKDGLTKLSYFPVCKNFGDVPEKRVSFPTKVQPQAPKASELQIELEKIATKCSDSLSSKVSRTMERQAVVIHKEFDNSSVTALSNDAALLKGKILPQATEKTSVSFESEQCGAMGDPCASLTGRQSSRETDVLGAEKLRSSTNIISKSTCPPTEEPDPTGTSNVESKLSTAPTIKTGDQATLQHPPLTKVETQTRDGQPAEAVVRSLCATAPRTGLEASILRMQPEDSEDVMLWPAHQPCKFTKDIFSTCQVLGQLDHKFILCVVDAPAEDVLPSAPTAGQPVVSPKCQFKKSHTTDDSDSKSCMSNAPPRAKMLVAFDQHAVHERVRLEALLADNLVNSSEHEQIAHEEDQMSLRAECGTKRVKQAAVSPGVVVTFSASDVRIMHACRDKLRRCGFEFQMVEGKTDTVQFTAVPACMLPRPLVTHALAAGAIEANGAHLIARDDIPNSAIDKMAPAPAVEELLCEGNSSSGAPPPLPPDFWTRWRGYRRAQIYDVVTYVCEQLRSCRTVSELPPPLLRVLHTHACRGAIRFGTGLRRWQCESLLRALSRCNLPFQCAHGRPSLAPLLLLTPPQNRQQKRVDFAKLLRRQGTQACSSVAERGADPCAR